MKTYKTEQQDVQVIESATCDKCHKPIEVFEFGGMVGVELVVDAGYGSKFDCGLLPETAPKFDLCDECCEELMKSLGWKETWPENEPGV